MPTFRDSKHPSVRRDYDLDSRAGRGPLLGRGARPKKENLRPPKRRSSISVFIQADFYRAGGHRRSSVRIPQNEARPKILVRQVVSRDDRLLCAYFDREVVFKKDINPFTVTDARVDPQYLLGVLNSRLMSDLYRNTPSIATKDDFRQTTLAELRRLPIRVPEKADRTDQDLTTRIGQLAREVWATCLVLSNSRTEDERKTAS